MMLIKIMYEISHIFDFLGWCWEGRQQLFRMQDLPEQRLHCIPSPPLWGMPEAVEIQDSFPPNQRKWWGFYHQVCTTCRWVSKLNMSNWSPHWDSGGMFGMVDNPRLGHPWMERGQRGGGLRCHRGQDKKVPPQSKSKGRYSIQRQRKIIHICCVFQLFRALLSKAMNPRRRWRCSKDPRKKLNINCHQLQHQ